MKRNLLKSGNSTSDFIPLSNEELAILDELEKKHKIKREIVVENVQRHLRWIEIFFS